MGFVRLRPDQTKLGSAHQIGFQMEYIRNLPELNVFFEGKDYVDIKVIEGSKSLREFIAGMLSYYPRWVVGLYRIREVIVAQDVSFVPGDNVAFFVVRKARNDWYWVSETPEDKHLRAYFGVVVENLDSGQARFHVFTTIAYKHWTGPVYFNLIRPFHHLVVSMMMRSAVAG